jgi:hypothetical protein
LYRLNQELLEVLSVTAKWVGDYAEKNNILFPNSSTYVSLILKTDALINEISSNYPDYEMISRRKVTTFNEKEGTDDNVTEPKLIKFKRDFFIYS